MEFFHLQTFWKTPATHPENSAEWLACCKVLSENTRIVVSLKMFKIIDENLIPLIVLRLSSFDRKLNFP